MPLMIDEGRVLSVFQRLSCVQVKVIGSDIRWQDCGIIVRRVGHRSRLRLFLGETGVRDDSEL